MQQQQNQKKSTWHTNLNKNKKILPVFSFVKDNNNKTPVHFMVPGCILNVLPRYVRVHRSISPFRFIPLREEFGGNHSGIESRNKAARGRLKTGRPHRTVTHFTTLLTHTHTLTTFNKTINTSSTTRRACLPSVPVFETTSNGFLFVAGIQIASPRRRSAARVERWRDPMCWS